MRCIAILRNVWTRIIDALIWQGLWIFQRPTFSAFNNFPGVLSKTMLTWWRSTYFSVWRIYQQVYVWHMVCISYNTIQYFFLPHLCMDIIIFRYKSIKYHIHTMGKIAYGYHSLICLIVSTIFRHLGFGSADIRLKLQIFDRKFLSL